MWLDYPGWRWRQTGAFKQHWDLNGVHLFLVYSFLTMFSPPSSHARVGAFPTSIKSLWNSNLSQLQRSHTWAVTSFGLQTIIPLVWRGVPLHLRQYWVQEVGCKDQWSLLGWQHPDKTFSQTGQPSYTWKEESLQKESQGSGQHFKAEPTTCAKSTPNRCAEQRERRIPQESLCNVKEKQNINLLSHDKSYLNKHCSRSYSKTP